MTKIQANFRLSQETIKRLDFLIAAFKTPYTEPTKTDIVEHAIKLMYEEIKNQPKRS